MPTLSEDVRRTNQGIHRQGSNVLSAGIDSVKDYLYVPVDSVINPAGNPGITNRDYSKEASSLDRIYMHGITDATLAYIASVLGP